MSDFKPADDFPADDSGYGFDNIGDVLSLSPVLMEKYLAAAEKIARRAIVADPPPKPTHERIEHAPVAAEEEPARDLGARHEFPVEGDYVVRGLMSGRHDAELITLWLDGKEIKTYPITTEDEAARVGEMRLHLAAGEHELKATLLHDDSRPDAQPDPDEAKAKDKKPGRNPYVERLEINGPYDPHARPLTESHKRIFICGLAPGENRPDCARRIVAALARRAYRRPVTEQEVKGLVRFVSMAQQNGDSFEQGVRVALEAILVSPHFLFRIEHDPSPNNPAASHRLDDYELASRLSYFLWSSMPDDELFAAGRANGKLRSPEVLTAEVRRMLHDPKVRRAGREFRRPVAGVAQPGQRKARSRQVSRIRRRSAQGDAARRRGCSSRTVMREDRSILDFIDGKYTFLNERLAQVLRHSRRDRAASSAASI